MPPATLPSVFPAPGILEESLPAKLLATGKILPVLEVLILVGSVCKDCFANVSLDVDVMAPDSIGRSLDEDDDTEGLIKAAIENNEVA